MSRPLNEVVTSGARVIVLPTVHLNGTSVDELYSQVRDAERALRTALEKLYAAAPNARDYYPQGEGAFERARKEHGRRLDDLIGVQAELVEIAAYLVDQKNARVRP